MKVTKSEQQRQSETQSGSRGLEPAENNNSQHQIQSKEGFLQPANQDAMSKTQGKKYYFVNPAQGDAESAQEKRSYLVFEMRENQLPPLRFIKTLHLMKLFSSLKVSNSLQFSKDKCFVMRRHGVFQSLVELEDLCSL